LYEIDQDSFGNGWAIYARAGWGWTVGGIMTASGVQPIPGTEENLFAVTYDGGYSLPNDSNQSGPPLPMAIREACIQLASTLFRSRGQDANVVAESDGDASIQRGYLGGVESAPASNGGLPGAIAAMVRPWRRGI